ncbi:ketopantoate reductase family protein [Ramlibacter sp. AN1133]|uniref:ketopantoate reductase family protein n=1 Tax=Ramlibacter sp. AN1133 TaxID=3133429 RepID=UPI0030C3E790
MRILVMGAGGVGGYFGGRLAQSGCDVSFVARGPHLEALQSSGLRVESLLGDLHLPSVSASSNPADFGPVDLVLFGVKLWDTEGAARLLHPVMGENTAVVSFQNGVLKDDILRDILGASHVVGGACYIAASVVEPGLIRHTGTMQKLVFGEYDGTTSARVRQFRDACLAAKIDVSVDASVERTIWEKYVFLVGLSGTTSLARTPIGPIRSDPRARSFLHDLMQEVVEVGRAQGIDLAPGYARNRLDFIDTLPASMSSSMLGDLERHGRLELEWLSGDVVHRGQRLGVDTPCNRAVLDILSVHSQGRSTPVAPASQ